MIRKNSDTLQKMIATKAHPPGSSPAPEEWQPAAGVQRSFVRYRSQDPSPAQVLHYGVSNGPVRLSVVIPTLDGSRGGYLAQLLKQLEIQNRSDFETLVVKGDPRQGRAINVAADLAGGDYLLTLDDDTSLPDPETFSRLIHVMEAHPDIGLAGGNNLIPQNAGAFVKRTMVNEITDSDLAEHPCLIMRTAEFKAVGGENEWIPRGLDPYLRREFRRAGQRVVVVPGVVYHHLPPFTPGLLLKQFYRNGRAAAFVNRYYPEWVIETPAHHGPFEKRVAPVRRFLRFGLQLARALTCGHLIWFAGELSYAIGFLAEQSCPRAAV